MHNYADEGIDMGKVLAIILGLSLLIPAVAEAKPKKYKKKSYYAYKYKYKKKKSRKVYRHYRKGPFKANNGAPADKVKLEEMIKELF